MSDAGHGPHPEDAMQRVSDDPLDEYIPGRYRALVADASALLALAAEELDAAATGDHRDKDSAVRMANAWIRLAEASARIAGKT
jgi:hypothetical protein